MSDSSHQVDSSEHQHKAHREEVYLVSKPKIRKARFLGEISPLNQIQCLGSRQLPRTLRQTRACLAKVQLSSLSHPSSASNNLKQPAVACSEVSLRVCLVEMRQRQILDSPLTQETQWNRAIKLLSSVVSWANHSSSQQPVVFLELNKLSLSSQVVVCSDKLALYSAVNNSNPSNLNRRCNPKPLSSSSIKTSWRPSSQASSLSNGNSTRSSSTCRRLILYSTTISRQSVSTLQAIQTALSQLSTTSTPRNWTKTKLNFWKSIYQSSSQQTSFLHSKSQLSLKTNLQSKFKLNKSLSR